MRSSTRSSPSVIDLTAIKPPIGATAEETPIAAADLSPVPVPPISSPPAQLAQLHLEQTEPIDDPASVALQVALLTATVRDLVLRVEQLEGKDETP